MIEYHAVIDQRVQAHLDQMYKLEGVQRLPQQDADFFEEEVKAVPLEDSFESDQIQEPGSSQNQDASSSGLSQSIKLASQPSLSK